MQTWLTARRSTLHLVFAMGLGMPAGVVADPAAPPTFRERMPDRHTRVDGLTAKQAAALFDTWSRIAGLLRGMPAVHAAKGVCTFLNTHVPKDYTPGSRPAASVMVLALSDGKCASEGFPVHIRVNTPFEGVATAELGADAAPLADEQGQRLYHVPPPTGSTVNHTRYRGAIVLTRGNVPLFQPVTRAQYVAALDRSMAAMVAGSATAESSVQAEHRRWLRDEKPKVEAQMEATLKEMARSMSPAELATARKAMRDAVDAQEAGLRTAAAAGAGQKAEAPAEMRAGLEAFRAQMRKLTAAELAQPACVPATPFTAEGQRACGTDKVMRLNPKAFDANRPPDFIQVISIDTDPLPYNADDAVTAAARLRVVDEIDTAGFAALLSK